MSETTTLEATPAVTFRQLLVLAGVCFAGLLVLLVAGVGGVYWAVNSGDGGGNRPAVLAADEAAETSGRDYLLSMAGAHSMAAEGVRRGDIRDRAGLAQYLSDQEARDKSFSPYNSAMESQLPQDFSGRVDSVASVLDDFAAGFTEAAE